MVSEQFAKISKPSRNGCYKDEKWIHNSKHEVNPENELPD